MAIVATPTYPVSGDEISLSVSSPLGNEFVYEIVSVPSASTLSTGLLGRVASGKTGTAQNLADDDSWFDGYTPDVPGEYVLKVFEYAKTVAAPRWDEDGTAEVWSRLVSTSTTTINVGAFVDLPIVTTAGHGAVLRLQINDETVRGATLVNPTTELARVAALDVQVTSALAAIPGLAVSAVATDIQAGVNDLLTKYEAHRQLTTGGVHAVADSVNVSSLFAAKSQDGAIALLNELRTRLVGHLKAGTWHHGVDDSKNVPLVGPASSLGQATLLLADLRLRVYDRHRQQISAPAVHNVADNTNTLTVATSAVDTVATTYADVIIDTNPSVTAGEAEGAIDAQHRYGFRSA